MLSRALSRTIGVAAAASVLTSIVVAADPASAAADSTSAIAYSTDRYSTNGDYQIALMDPAGVSSQVTADDGDHDTPAISPDGTKLAYTSNHGNANTDDYDLWVADINGANPHKLVTSTAYADGAPAWSPDGTTIAFSRIPLNDAAPSVWLVSAVGGTATQVPGTTGEMDPTWSPNGRLLAVSHVISFPAPIVITSRDGSYRHTLSGASGYDPSWSPDGASISFVQFVGGNPALSVVPANGGIASTKTLADIAVTSQVWSPDGSQIVFEGYKEGASGSLWTIPTNWSAGPTALADAGGRDQVSPSIVAPQAVYTPAPPAPIAALSATLASGNVNLAWSAPAGTAYVVVRRSAAGAPAPTTPELGTKVYTGTGTSATATGLVNGSTYSFSVFAMNYRGDASLLTTRTARPAATPSVSPNGSVLGVLSGAGPKFVAKWGSALPAGQVYDVQVGTRTFSGGKWSAVTWKALVTGTAATSQVVNAAAGTTYYLRARVRDEFGNVTAWSGSAIAPVPYDGSSFTSSGAWSNLTGQTGRFMNTVRVGKAAGAKLSVATYGTSFSVVADKCVGCGQVRVYVDGVFKSTVDTRASSTLTRQIVWTSGTYSLSRHTISLVVVGTASRPQVRIDALIARR